MHPHIPTIHPPHLTSPYPLKNAVVYSSIVETLCIANRTAEAAVLYQKGIESGVFKFFKGKV